MRLKTINFKIKAGRHYANNMLRFRLLFSKRLKVTWSISHFAYYDYLKVVNGYSKIIGISDFHPHGTSCRLAFMNSSTGLNVAIYSYYKGVRTMKPITTILPGVRYELEISRSKGLYTLTHIDNGIEYTEIAQATNLRLPFRFVLHPYVGGRFSLDHDLSIKITKH